MKGGFFQCLARAGFNRALARVQVAGRVVQAQAFGRVFLNQQELGHAGHLAGDDGGDRDAGLPDCAVHCVFSGQTLFLAMKSAMRPTPARIASGDAA